jgi:starch phosphorylase
VSEQISLAGYEASGTSNMKFMMNGALTIGTRDGANIEIARAAGEDNVFFFGLTAQEAEQSRPWYSPQWHFEAEPEIRGALDLIASGHFSPKDPALFRPLVDLLLLQGDRYMLLADLKPYVDAQARLGGIYADQPRWLRAAIMNIASAGHFSIDRTVSEYARTIWDIHPCHPL